VLDVGQQQHQELLLLVVQPERDQRRQTPELRIVRLLQQP
jgi:hypothetical protein